MWFPIEVRDHEVPALIYQYVNIVGEEVLAKKFSWIARELEDNPYMAEWLNEYHGIESTLAEVLQSLIESGRLPTGHPTCEQYALYSFVVGVVQIYERLLRVMTPDFLASDNRTHIHTVAYRARGALFEQERGSLTEQGVSFFIENPRNPAAGNEGCRIFASSRARACRSAAVQY